MLSKAKIDILNLFRKNILIKSSIKGIADRLKKSYPRVYEAVKDFEKQGILNLERIGRSDVVSINLNNKSISLLSFLDEQETFKKNIPHYEKIVSIKEISSYIVIITGSYAKGKYTKKSDVDLVIIVHDNENIVKLHKLIENKSLVWHPPVHPYVLRQKDFIEMLLTEEKNYGKEIFKNHIILKNSQVYYEVIKEAIKHGFRG